MSQTLIFADVHQDTAWVRSILQRETEVKHLVSLGDWFDSRNHYTDSGQKATAALMGELQNSMETDFLLGNHDAPYLSAIITSNATEALTCSGWSPYENEDIVEGWTQSGFDFGKILMWKDLGCLLASHAGVRPDLRPRLHEVQSAVEAIRNGHSMVQDCGYSRGGLQREGGLTWWSLNEVQNSANRSFGRNQISGHNKVNGALVSVAADDTKHIIIDGGQTVYGLLEGNTLTLKSTEGPFDLVVCKYDSDGDGTYKRKRNIQHTIEL